MFNQPPEAIAINPNAIRGPIRDDFPTKLMLKIFLFNFLLIYIRFNQGNHLIFV